MYMVYIDSNVQAQLCKELNEEKFKNQLLTRFVVSVMSVTSVYTSWCCLATSRKLQEANQQKVQIGGHKIFQGQKLNRSMSIA